MAKILVVDDEPDMAMGLRDNLQFEGYDVVVANDGDQAIEIANHERPDLILLDVMMPKRDGLEVCTMLRESGYKMPILMLTAKGQEIDVVKGLEAGADDYITKPFGLREVLARIKAALRRTDADAGIPKVVRVGSATVDLVRGKVDRGEHSFSLGYFETEILKMLIENAEEVVPRNKLLDTIWGLEGFPANRTVDNHIVSLRRKIEDDAKHPVHIVTVHSVGYKYVP
jgi:DNA-binding response OmpR family regulator